MTVTLLPALMVRYWCIDNTGGRFGNDEIRAHEDEEPSGYENSILLT